MKTHLRAAERHLPYGSYSVTCHSTQVNAPTYKQVDAQFAHPRGIEG